MFSTDLFVPFVLLCGGGGVAPPAVKRWKASIAFEHPEHPAVAETGLSVYVTSPFLCATATWTFPLIYL